MSVSLTGPNMARGEGDRGAAEDMAALESLTLHIAGDSTAARFSASDETGRVGWGSVLQPFFGESVVVNDAARSGRSSKSFIDEGHWQAVESQIEPGDYVLVQFAHNDEKAEDPLRYTEPGTTFKEHLKQYVDETIARGGSPVLLTPISRLEYQGTAIKDTHGDYPEAVMELAEETNTPLIDMTNKTRVLFESLGLAEAVPLFATGDRTHLSADGAVVVAGLVV